MDLTTPPAQITPQPSAALSLPSAGSNAVLSSDFETFLQMLTAQAKYQDPLEPIDSSEYAAQLAQFSMVEQQVQSNEILNRLADQMGAGDLVGMAGWIGMEARTTAPVRFDGAPVSITPTFPAGTDEMFLVVYDDAGTQVQRQPLTVSNDPVLWAGVSDDGAPFATGTYALEIEARGQGELLNSTPAAHYARITEARNELGTTVLVLEGGQAVNATGITALRDAT